MTAFCEALNDNFNVIYERESTTAFTTCFAIFKTLQEMAKYLDGFLKRKKMFLELYKLNTIEATLNSKSMSIQIIKSRMKNNDGK